MPDRLNRLMDLFLSFFLSFFSFSQVAFAYLEHIAANGEDVAVEVEAVDGQTITVCEAKDKRTQMLAYRERAQVSW